MFNVLIKGLIHKFKYLQQQLDKIFIPHFMFNSFKSLSTKQMYKNVLSCWKIEC